MRIYPFVQIVWFVLLASTVYASEADSVRPENVLDVTERISYAWSENNKNMPIKFESWVDCGQNEGVNNIASALDLIEPTLNYKRENALISAQKGIVTRSGRSLKIKRGTLSPIVFKDALPKRGDAGDDERFVYAGLLGSTGYHRVEVNYKHDVPGTYFLRTDTDAMFYVHNGEYVPLLTKNGLMIIFGNSPTPPFGIIIVNLTGSKPKIQLQCVSHSATNDDVFEGWNNKVTSSLIAWRDLPEAMFDILLDIPGKNEINKIDGVHIRFKFDSEWHICMQPDDIPDVTSRLSCWR
jgi:hypothetical protein